MTYAFDDVFAKLNARDFANSIVSVLNSRVQRALSFQVRISTCSIAMEDLSLPDSTCSSQSQLLDSLQSQQTGSFQNQPPEGKGSVVLLLCWTSPTVKSQAFHREPARTLPDPRLLPLLPQPLNQEGTL